MTARIEIIRGLALGGAETLLYQRLRSETELRLLDPRQVVVINTAPSDRAHFTEALSQLGASVTTLRHRGVLSGAPELLGLIRESWPGTPVVLHSPGPGIALKAARALGNLSNPIIEVAHSTQYRAAYQGLGQVLNRFADACIAVSDDVAQARTTAGFPFRTVIHGGVDKARMRRWIVEDGVAGAERLRRGLGIPVDAQVVVAVGNLVKLKGHESLVRSFARVHATIPDAHLLIVGSGPEQASLMALAEGL
ncbi:MAG: glycosyltransferase, partial [Brooklawnia sp.]